MKPKTFLNVNLNKSRLTNLAADTTYLTYEIQHNKMRLIVVLDLYDQYLIS